MKKRPETLTTTTQEAAKTGTASKIAQLLSVGRKRSATETVSVIELHRYTEPSSSRLVANAIDLLSTTSTRLFGGEPNESEVKVLDGPESTHREREKILGNGIVAKEVRWGNSYGDGTTTTFSTPSGKTLVLQKGFDVDAGEYETLSLKNSASDDFLTVEYRHGATEEAITSRQTLNAVDTAMAIVAQQARVIGDSIGQ